VSFQPHHLSGASIGLITRINSLIHTVACLFTQLLGYLRWSLFPPLVHKILHCKLSISLFETFFITMLSENASILYAERMQHFSMELDLRKRNNFLFSFHILISVCKSDYWLSKWNRQVYGY
jgi:hypothetical protein